MRTGFINSHADFRTIWHGIEYLHTAIHLLVIKMSIDSFTLMFKVFCGREVLISVLTAFLFKALINLTLGKVLLAFLLL